VIAGTYTVTEGALPDGWIADGATEVTVTVPINGIGEADFANTAMGTLKIVKTTTGGDGTFDYTVSGGLTAVDPQSITTSGGSESVSIPVIAGTYTVTEGALPDGWIADGATEVTVTVPINGIGEADFANTKVPPSMFTNSSLCQFDFDPNVDGRQFRLIYIMDSPSSWRLNSSNPGQFYYNVFYFGEPGEEVNLDINIAAPFVTQGAQPVHVYSTYKIVTCSCGGYCLQPGTDVTSTFGIQDGIITGVDGGTINVSGEVPATGTLCVTVHLDYGLKRTSGWSPSSVDGVIDAKNTGMGITISGLQEYEFSYYDGVETCSETTWSENVVKKFAGFMGEVTGKSDEEPRGNVKVLIYNSSNSLVGTVCTDEDGYYLFEYKHKAKAATYKVKLPAYKMETSVTIKANGFAIVNFETP
jgi:hypothetical protein